MFNELQEIKHLRKKLGLTQGELAKYAGVSQSLIAKVESDSIDPTFTNAQKIFTSLQQLSEKEEQKAVSVMNKNLIYLEPTDSLRVAIQKMKKYSISQLPVLEQKKAVGVISETAILDALMNNKSADTPLLEVMSEAPPIIDTNASIHVVSHLLKFYPMILVAEKGKLLGLITKADLLQVAYK
ncbi:CBS domain-containing protein [Candidatus Woesearchaeota archaeon]|nr:CBS domain-containing protein [Candidatus Woesearchaeota archaeon]